MPESRKGSDESMLDLFRKGGGKTVEIHLLRSDSFRLHKYLMALPIRESHHLIFNGGAVSRSFSNYLSSIERRAVHIFPDYPVGFLIGISYPASS